MSAMVLRFRVCCVPAVDDESRVAESGSARRAKASKLDCAWRLLGEGGGSHVRRQRGGDDMSFDECKKVLTVSRKSGAPLGETIQAHLDDNNNKESTLSLMPDAARKTTSCGMPPALAIATWLLLSLPHARQDSAHAAFVLTVSVAWLRKRATGEGLPAPVRAAPRTRRAAARGARAAQHQQVQQRVGLRHQVPTAHRRLQARHGRDLRAVPATTRP